MIQQVVMNADRLTRKKSNDKTAERDEAHRERWASSLLQGMVASGVLDYQVVGEAEVHNRFGWDIDIAITGGACKQGA